MLEAVTNIEDVLAERPRDQTGKGRIDIRDVSVTFGKGRSSHRAVESTRLQIEPGEFVCLLVPRGAENQHCLTRSPGLSLRRWA